MGSPSAIITLGLGTWGSVNEVITLGYGSTTAVVPDPGDVRLGVVYDANNLPAASDVRLGVVYG